MTETRPMPETVLPLRRDEPYIGVEQVAFLVANPRRGKKPWRRRSQRVFLRARSRRHRASGGSGYERRQRHWIGETITAGGTTTQTRFVYDGNQIVMQLDKAGTGDLAATDLSHRYLWGPAVDQLLAEEQLSSLSGGEGYDLTQQGQVVWTLTDNQNTVRDLATYSDGTTTVVNHRVFSAYGQMLSQTNPTTGYAATVDCLFAYTGRALDQATGLQNNDNRWYDSITGRWLSQDPIAFAGGDANLYRYVENGPTNATDPTGEDAALTVPGGHAGVAVEVRDSSGNSIGVLTADYGGQEWQSGDQGSIGATKAVWSENGELLLAFTPGAKLKGSTIIKGTPSQDSRMLDWILKQAGKDRAWFDKQTANGGKLPTSMKPVGEYAEYSAAKGNTCYGFALDALYNFVKGRGYGTLAPSPATDEVMKAQVDQLVKYGYDPVYLDTMLNLSRNPDLGGGVF